jgi:hypothetical protein
MRDECVQPQAHHTPTFASSPPPSTATTSTSSTPTAPSHPHRSTVRERTCGPAPLAARSRSPWPRILCTYTTLFKGRGRQVTPVRAPYCSALDLAGFLPARRARHPAPPTGVLSATGANMPTARRSGCLASAGHSVYDARAVSALSPHPNAFRHPIPLIPRPPPQRTRTQRLHPEYSRPETMRTRHASTSRTERLRDGDAGPCSVRLGLPWAATMECSYRAHGTGGASCAREDGPLVPTDLGRAQPQVRAARAELQCGHLECVPQ